MTNSTQDLQGILAEVQKTKETAAKLANGDYPKDADHVRVLAGMIQKLAEQIERLAGGDGGSETAATGTRDRSDVAAYQAARKDAEAAVEEDRTPSDAPAEPINDRSEA